MSPLAASPSIDIGASPSLEWWKRGWKNLRSLVVARTWSGVGPNPQNRGDVLYALLRSRIQVTSGDAEAGSGERFLYRT